MTYPAKARPPPRASSGPPLAAISAAGIRMNPAHQWNRPLPWAAVATVAHASPATARLVSQGRLLREYGSANDVRSASTLTPTSLARGGPAGPSGQPYRRRRLAGTVPRTGVSSSRRPR